MSQLLRTIIFAILIIGVITKTELPVSTNKTNNEHNTISLNKKPTVAEFDEGLVGAITQVKTSVSTNKTNDEHISLDIKPNITKVEVLPTGNEKWLHMLYGGIMGSAFALLALRIYRYHCHPYCEEYCQRWISRFFPTRPAEMPVREREVELVQMPQRQEEIHNLPPNVIERHL